jgi:electron transfer flavoprotein alpha subunit
MSVLVFAEVQEGKFKKVALEAVTFGVKTADLMGTQCIALVIGECTEPEILGQYGVGKIWTRNDKALNHLDSQVYTHVIAAAYQKADAKVLIISHNSTGKSIAGRLSAKLKAGLVSGVNQLPQWKNDQLYVVKPVFSGKALSTTRFTSEHAVISLAGNAIKPAKKETTPTVESLDMEIPASKIKIKEVSTVKGIVPLPEAEIVVSAGRGMKGPENWGMIEELAETLGATTACSRPVADADWRPHHEHVGQTGIAIRPNLYIAIGISGAIQHLAGVNNSKVIVVINKDPEAPFFKAADYGVVGDLFEVVPKLNTALMKFNENNV